MSQPPIFRRWIASATLAAFAAISAPIALAEPPSFSGLGFMSPAAVSGKAGAISADGRTIIGGEGFGCDADANCPAVGWVWRDGQFQSVNALIGAPTRQQIFAEAVSGDGSTLALSDTSTDQAYLWRNGALTPLSQGAPTEWIQDWTTAISDDGTTVTGTHYDIAGANMEGWQWQDNARVGIGYLYNDPNMISSWARGMSGDGHVVVGQSSTELGGQAFRWSDGQMVGLGYLREEIVPDPNHPGLMNYPESSAIAASFNGSVIVGTSASDNTHLFETEAFRWESGVMVGLGDLPGGAFYSEALSVSADGSIIVGTGVMEGGHRAFIWDEAHGMRLLEDVLSGAGLDLTGWKLISATDISADGTVIVGFGENPQGISEPFRAVIPEPASLFFEIIVAISLLGHRRRRR